jgi:DNA invertase Pin-like site-specific DNA recombinase
MRVALLSRVSTGKQDNENQLLQLRKFADQQGWTFAGEYVDVITGSGTKTREQFNRMMEHASQRKFDCVLFWSLDRLSREGVLETLQHLQRLTGYGVAWRSFTEQYLDSTGIFRDAVIGILAAVAKQERVRLSERTRAGLEKARRLGHIPGPKPFSVDLDAVRQRKLGGESLRAIARSLQVSHALLIKRLKAA